MRPFLCLAFLACALNPAVAQSTGDRASPTTGHAAADFAPARRLMQQGKYDGAIAQLQELSAKDPDQKGLAHELGVAYYKKGDFPKAIEFLKKASAQEAADQEGVRWRGLSDCRSVRPAHAMPFSAESPGCA